MNEESKESQEFWKKLGAQMKASMQRSFFEHVLETAMSDVTNNFGPGFSVGPSKEAVDAVAAGVMEILSAPHLDQKTLQIALKVFGKGVSIGNTTISGCSVVNGQPSKTAE